MVSQHAERNEHGGMREKKELKSAMAASPDGFWKIVSFREGVAYLPKNGNDPTRSHDYSLFG